MTVIGSAGGAGQMRVRPLARRRSGDRLQGRARCSRASPQAAPEGIDVYFDNVGGDHLDAAFALARNNARFAICGMIEGYNQREPTSFRFIMRIIAARIRLKGFIVFDYFPRMDEFYARDGAVVASGAVKSRETVVDGLENDARSVPRPVQRREHRKDARPPLELADVRDRRSCSRAAALPSAAPTCRG